MAKSFWDSERQVGKNVPKSGTKSTFYKVKLVSKNDKRYVDLREHYTSAAGVEVFTTKGTAIPVADIPALIEALQLARQC